MKNYYEDGRNFIMSEVVTREAISKFCAKNNLIKPQIGESWLHTCSEEAQVVVRAFGDYGDWWDGEPNEFVTQKQVDSWKKFLLISDETCQFFFHLTPNERQEAWIGFKEERSSDTFWNKLTSNKANGIDYFKNNKYGERLLLLHRLSRIYADDMFMNYAGNKMLDFIGSDEQLNFYQRLGKDGLKFNGQENDYLSQQEIDQERKKLGITKEEFNRFYMLDYGQRYLLLESRFIY